MPCHYPVQAFKCSDGGIVFEERKGDVVHEIRLPCGCCDGCKLERSRQWAVRCMHEASLYEQNAFITLTYNDEHLPLYNDLDYRDFQLFMKRLRKRFTGRKIRFFMCGEYGENNGRPHFHACLFNISFDDRVHFKNSSSGSKIYTSKILQSLWCTKEARCTRDYLCDGCVNSIGYCTVGDVNFQSAGYVARYVMKKRYGRGNDEVYQEIDKGTGEVITRAREFTRMSLKNGIGYDFYKKWKSDIFPNDYCVVNGVQTKPPKYYTKKLAEEDEKMYDCVITERAINGISRSADNTLDRLEVKEKVLQARLKLLKREL